MSIELKAFIEYITIKALNHSTIEAYKLDLMQIEKFTKKNLVELDLNQVLSSLENTPNKRTINIKISSVNSFYDFCYKLDILEERFKIKLSKFYQNLPKYISYEELIKKIETIDKSSWLGKRENNTNSKRGFVVYR